jgi:hypothetical protein
MRRAEVITAVRNVKSALIKSNLGKSLGEVMNVRTERGDRPSESSARLLRAFREYSHLAASFGPTESRLIEIFRLEPLDNPEAWLQAIAGEPEVIHLTLAPLRFVVDELEKIIDLLKTDAERIGQTLASTKAGNIAEEEVLSVIVIEEEGRFSSPERLVKALRSISVLYEVIATLGDVNSSTLSVVGCDSGSDKAFDFLGLASVVKGVKEILIAVWDRVVFYREKKIEAKLDLISRSLPIIEHIASLEQEKAIGPEQAEILRRRVTEGVTMFVEAGVMTVEIAQRSTYNPRQLLAPEPKLLVAATGLDEQLKPDVPSSDLGTLSPDENETLRKLLDKKKGKDPR